MPDINFANKTPAQVAEELAWGHSHKFPVSLEREILAAIHHFSNRNLIAARRYELIKSVLLRSLPFGPELVGQAEIAHPEPKPE